MRIIYFLNLLGILTNWFSRILLIRRWIFRFFIIIIIVIIILRILNFLLRKVVVYFYIIVRIIRVFTFILFLLFIINLIVFWQGWARNIWWTVFLVLSNHKIAWSLLTFIRDITKISIGRIYIALRILVLIIAHFFWLFIKNNYLFFVVDYCLYFFIYYLLFFVWFHFDILLF